MNPLKGKKKKFKFKFDATEDEEIFEKVSDWCNDNFGDEEGFYELDGWNKDFIIQLNDEEDDWEESFEKVAEKVAEYIKTF